MSPRQRRILGAGLALATFGCRTGPELANGFDAQLTREELTVHNQTLTRIEVQDLVEVQGPAGATLTHARVDWLLDGVVQTTTDASLNNALEQDGHAALALKVTLATGDNAQELLALEKRGSLRVTARGILTLLWKGNLRELELARTREVRAPHLLRPSVREVNAGRYDNGELTATIYLGLQNPNAFPIRLRSLHYRVMFAGHPVGEDTVGQAEWVQGSASAEFELEEFLDASSPEILQELGHASSVPYRIEGEVATESYTQPFSLEGTLHLKKG